MNAETFWTLDAAQQKRQLLELAPWRVPYHVCDLLRESPAMKNWVIKPRRPDNMGEADLTRSIELLKVLQLLLPFRFPRSLIGDDHGYRTPLREVCQLLRSAYSSGNWQAYRFLNWVEGDSGYSAISEAFNVSFDEPQHWWNAHETLMAYSDYTVLKNYRTIFEGATFIIGENGENGMRKLRAPDKAFAILALVGNRFNYADVYFDDTYRVNGMSFLESDNTLNDFAFSMLCEVYLSDCSYEWLEPLKKNQPDHPLLQILNNAGSLSDPYACFSANLNYTSDRSYPYERLLRFLAALPKPDRAWFRRRVGLIYLFRDLEMRDRIERVKREDASFHSWQPWHRDRWRGLISEAETEEIEKWCKPDRRSIYLVYFNSRMTFPKWIDKISHVYSNEPLAVALEYRSDDIESPLFRHKLLWGDENSDRVDEIAADL